MGVWGQASSEFAGYDYVQTATPSNPEEGETWYDIDDDGAFVFDGANWVEMTVTDHGQLSGITEDAHRSDSNIQGVVDGVVDADTVDGQHASDMGASSTQTGGGGPSKSVGLGSGQSTVDEGGSASITASPPADFTSRWYSYEVTVGVSGEWNYDDGMEVEWDSIEVRRYGSWETLDTNLGTKTGEFATWNARTYTFGHAVEPEFRLNFSAESSSSGQANSKVNIQNGQVTGSVAFPHTHDI